MKQGDRVIKCTKDGHICGVGYFDISNTNFDFFIAPDDFGPNHNADWSLKDKYKKLKYRYVNDIVVEDAEIPTQDEIDYFGFKEKYSLEERVELQDEAISSIIAGNPVSSEVQEYMANKQKYKVAKSKLK